ncbi:hypothetical protein ES703_68529 [subsurface metagenome]
MPEADIIGNLANDTFGVKRCHARIEDFFYVVGDVDVGGNCPPGKITDRKGTQQQTDARGNGGRNNSVKQSWRLRR